VDTTFEHRNGLVKAAHEPATREVWLLQRTAGRLGRRLNKTTGWVHRRALRAKDVKLLGGVQYDKIDQAGLHITREGQAETLVVDNVIICAGQESERSLADALVACGITTHVIGGADVAVELDAVRAIAQGTRLAARI
jgi:2,4-dienoyl-CoA reductase (NADPH2)